MEILDRKVENVRVVEVKGRIDASTAAEFGNAITALIDAGEARLVLDLEGLEYISSAGLREFLKAAKALKAKSGKFAVCGLRDYVREVFDMSGFDTIIPIHSCVDDAIEVFGQP
ncbi:anti-anti-sigma factor [Oceanidesulfovibrio indonesiensis]|uniref:Anti-sigma factor antagonist n=1 Tax=Oceanidesulfovibrio indonesiensis TaxID=54767 RepID=A0A7M3MF37_9BACT|nr:STAS domain-containing protein [Oceanidesulfovibrio indonesiensis]TVM17631.1 anti-anti-sigma factor [Oceanidesulfovibrio indonesiensis]